MTRYLIANLAGLLLLIMCGIAVLVLTWLLAPALTGLILAALGILAGRHLATLHPRGDG